MHGTCLPQGLAHAEMPSASQHVGTEKIYPMVLSSRTKHFIDKESILRFVLML